MKPFYSLKKKEPVIVARKANRPARIGQAKFRQVIFIKKFQDLRYLDQRTLPYLISDFRYPPDVFKRIPFQTTKPSSSVLKKSIVFSKIFLFGFKTGRICSFLNNSSCPYRQTLSPIFPSGLKMLALVPSLSSAQTTMPLDINLARGRGFKLAITITKPLISSKGTSPCRPDAIYLTYVPMLILSQQSFSDSGCFQHSTISPILISI